MFAKKIFWALKKWWSDVSGTREYFRYLEKDDRRRRLAGQFLTLITIVLGIIYLVWHWKRINWDVWHYALAFFFAESTGLLLFSFFAFNSWFLRYHSPQGIAFERTFSVDIFIPVAGESFELVRQTVEAALKIDFQNKQVYILDDKENEEFKKLAETSCCGYFARKDHSDAKAGNMNYAFQRTQGDLILALDADQVPHPQIINKLIGYFKIPKIAFVQTKQDYKLPVGDPFGNSDSVFYNVMQSGKDNDNSAFSCGSGVIYQREALKEIGGFSTWNLVEDLHTSMLLHERGWRSVYYNHPLSKGTAPADIYGVYRQRLQWAADSLRLIFWDGPYRRKGLTFKQKYQYFNVGFVYIVAAFIMPFFFITPILALLTNEFVLISPVPTYVQHRFPYFIAMSMAYGTLNYPTPYLKAFQMWTGLFPVFIRATWIALRSRKKKPAYRVNVKSVGHVKVKNPWLAVLPQLGIIFLSLFSIIYVFIKGGMGWNFYLLNFTWSTWSIWTMSGICLAAIRKHKWPKEEALEENSEDKKAPSFFSRTKELILTLIIAGSVLLFFTFSDPVKTDQFMDRLRLNIIQTINIEKPVERTYKPVVRPVEASVPDLKEIVYNPEKPALQVDFPGKTEESIKTGNWAVHVISEKTQKRATVYKEKLIAAGFPAYTNPANVKGQDWIRVRVGFFSSKEEAEKVGERIQRTDSIPKGPYWITRVSAKEKENFSEN